MEQPLLRSNKFFFMVFIKLKSCSSILIRLLCEATRVTATRPKSCTFTCNAMWSCSIPQDRLVTTVSEIRDESTGQMVLPGTHYHLTRKLGLWVYFWATSCVLLTQGRGIKGHLCDLYLRWDQKNVMRHIAPIRYTHCDTMRINLKITFNLDVPCEPQVCC